MRRASVVLLSLALVGCNTSTDETDGNAADPVGFVLSFVIDGTLRDLGLPFEAFTAEVQTTHGDTFIAKAGDRVLFIALRSTAAWSSWDGDPIELLLGPLRVSATSVLTHRDQLPRFDSVTVVYNDPLGTGVEMTGEDFEAYGRGQISDEQALDRMIVSGTP